MNPDIALKRLRQASFLTSAATFDQCPPDAGREVAFVGRSNAGKSSVLNRIADNGRLARTSRTPGRTQLLNFFALDDLHRLVDLPGYGFARAQARQQRAWETEMTRYLHQRSSLAGLVLVMDIRHPMQEMDANFVRWALQANVPVQILLNKADKLSKSQAKTTLMRIRALLDSWPAESAGVQLFSATKSAGVSELREQLAHWLGFESKFESA